MLCLKKKKNTLFFLSSVFVTLSFFTSEIRVRNAFNQWAKAPKNTLHRRNGRILCQRQVMVASYSRPYSRFCSSVLHPVNKPEPLSPRQHAEHPSHDEASPAAVVRAGQRSSQIWTWNQEEPSESLSFIFCTCPRARGRD